VNDVVVNDVVVNDVVVNDVVVNDVVVNDVVVNDVVEDVRRATYLDRWSGLPDVSRRAIFPRFSWCLGHPI
jgi:hypothetical protein